MTRAQARVCDNRHRFNFYFSKNSFVLRENVQGNVRENVSGENFLWEKSESKITGTNWSNLEQHLQSNILILVI